MHPIIDDCDLIGAAERGGEAEMIRETELLHRQSANHRRAVEQSTICGCFHCQEFFYPAAITEWVDTPAGVENGAGQTALCPRCGVDAVLPERNGVYPMGVDLLRHMHWRWFGEGVAGRAGTTAQ